MLRDVKEFDGRYGLVLDRNIDYVLRSWPYRARITVKYGCAGFSMMAKMSVKNNANLGMKHFAVSKPFKSRSITI